MDVTASKTERKRERVTECAVTRKQCFNETLTSYATKGKAAMTEYLIRVRACKVYRVSRV
jgi:hypothetical protein